MDSRRYYKSIVFALGFLLAQSAVMFAEFNHPLHKADSACSICLAANHLSAGIITENQIAPPGFQHVLVENLRSNFAIFSILTPYHVRAPPLH